MDSKERERDVNERNDNINNGNNNNNNTIDSFNRSKFAIFPTLNNQTNKIFPKKKVK